MYRLLSVFSRKIPAFIKEDNIFQRDYLNLKQIKKCNETTE